MNKICWCNDDEIRMTLEKKDGMHVVRNGKVNLIISDKLASKIKDLNYPNAMEAIENDLHKEI